MPHFLGVAHVRRLVHAVHDQVCTMADVRVVCMAEATRADGMEELMDDLQQASCRGRRLSEGFSETMCFSISDQRHSPYHAANELARWADILLIVPMCAATQSAITHGREDDLLLEIVQGWRTVKKRRASGEYWIPEKPFLVAPRIPAERRNQYLIELDRAVIERMGVEIIDGPTEAEAYYDEVIDAAGQDKYVNHVIEHVRHAILKMQGHLEITSCNIESAAPKRRRGAA